MANVGYATLTIIPSARGFEEQLSRQTRRPAEGVGRRAGGGFSSALMGAVGGIGGKLALASGVGAVAAGIGVVTKEAIGLEATFSKTMNTMGAVANVPKKELSGLSDLAMKMGKDTTFSASEAADAMLELAKGGISPADIAAGGLKGTLTLAAAGGTDLATAATIASNAMNTFGLKGKDMGSIAAALAGGANASSASVESLAEGLSQVGPGAKNAGLSLQDTVGILAEFDAKGIKGSDAGTSLKTMLTRLVPSSKKAADKMKELGLNFKDAQGNFLPMTDVAEQLKTKMSGLSETEKSAALNTMFGSDATRAATVLMEDGAAGVKKYADATKDQGAAQRTADAAMKGTAGAIEGMKGSLETAKLAFGKLIAPVVQASAKGLGVAFGAIATVIGKIDIGKAFGAIGKIGGMFGGIGGKADGLKSKITGIFADLRIDVIARQLAGIGKAIFAFGASIGGALKKAAGDVWKTLGPALTKIGTTIKTTVLPALLGLLPAYKNIMRFSRAVASVILGVLSVAFKVILAVARPVVTWLIRFFGKLLANTFKTLGGVIKSVMVVIAGIFNVISGILTGKWGKAWAGVKQIVTGALRAVLGIVKGLLGTLWIIITSLLGKVVSWVVSGFVNVTKRLFMGLFVSLPLMVLRGLARIIVAVVSFGGKVIASIGRAMARFASAVGKGIAAAVRWYISLPGKILAALANLGTALWNIAKSGLGRMAEGIVNGIKVAREAAGKVLSAVKQKIWDAFKAAAGWGFELIGNIIDGIRNGVKQLGDIGGQIVRWIIDKAKAAIGLGGKKSEKMMAPFMGGIEKGVKKRVPQLASTFAAAGTMAAQAFANGTMKRKPKLLPITANDKKVFKNAINAILPGKLLGRNATQIGSELNSLIAKIKAFTKGTKLEGKGNSVVTGILAKQKGYLTPLANQWVNYGKSIATAVEARDRYKASYDDFASSLRGELDLVANSTDVASLTGYLDTQLASVDRYQENLKSLIAKGASSELLAKINEAGLAAGGQMAESLAAGSQDEIAQINSRLAQFATKTGGAAELLTQKMYGVGYEAQAAFVKGLQDQQAATQGKIDKIGKDLLASIKKTLQIGSPSKAMISIGGSMIDGLVLGMVQGAARAKGAMRKVADDSRKHFGAGADGKGTAKPGVAKAPKSAKKKGAAGGGPVTRLVVPVSLDGREIARAVFDVGGDIYANGRKDV